MSELIEKCNHVNSIDQNQLSFKILMNIEENSCAFHKRT